MAMCTAALLRVSGGVGTGQKEGNVVVRWSVRGQGVEDRCAQVVQTRNRAAESGAQPLQSSVDVAIPLDQTIAVQPYHAAVR